MKRPVVLARCCIEWWMPMPGWAGPWGRCGYCGEVPAYIGPIPEEDWPDDNFE